MAFVSTSLLLWLPSAQRIPFQLRYPRSSYCANAGSRRDYLISSSLSEPERYPQKKGTRSVKRTKGIKRTKQTKQTKQKKRISNSPSNTNLPNSEPDDNQQSPQATLPTTTDYSNWSSDFLQLCNEQLHLLMLTVPNVDTVALFFRHQNEDKGVLEFIPLIVHTSGEDDKPARVWISSGTGGETELENAVPSRALPGSVPANWILPDYPFTSVAHHGGIYMADGGLCVPVKYNDVVAGTIIMRPKLIARKQETQWKKSDIERVDMVAKSIALAAALEGKWHAYKGLLGTSRTLLESARSLIRNTLHQIRSPLQALVIFGHLMMRKLPVNDSNRDLAKHVIVEALRLEDLLKPLDEAHASFVLPEGIESKSSLKKRRRLLERTKISSPFFTDEKADSSQTPLSSASEPSMGSPESLSSPFSADLYQPLDDGPQLIWLADLVQPQAQRAEVLALERGITFVSDIDDDSPPALTVEKFIREAISNLVDNAIAYSPKGSYMGISTRFPDNSEERSLSKHMTRFVVWDTGYGIPPNEKDNIFEYGFRGSAAAKSGAHGTGLGLGITRQLLRSSNGKVEIRSPLPALWDPRSTAAKEKADLPGTAFVVSLKRPSCTDSADEN